MIIRKAAPYAAVAVLVAAAAFAPAGWSDEPIHLGEPVTVYRTVRVTVAARVDGHDVHWWVRHSRWNGARRRQAELNATVRGRTIATLRAANHARLDLGPDALTQDFLCIHGFEGSWTDTGSPYYGGVQMDSAFMAGYGAPFLHAWGTADRWPPFVQVAVAEAAYLSGRGFGPWPNTARMCGL